MGFTEITFLFVFMPLSIMIYLLAEKFFHNDRVNNSILVVLSMLFYCWANKETLVIFVALIIFTYMAGCMIEPKSDSRQGKQLAFFVVCLIGTLAYYKYISFVAKWINQLSDKDLITVRDIIIPVGISFIIFESVSYVVDIYRGDAAPGNLLDCATFLSLFPKLVSGPIVLWKDFKPQLVNRRLSIKNITSGIDRIIIGYAKKAIIADTFGIQIAEINNGIATGGIDVPSVWLKALLYFFQLYFDFSGYSDIAIGLCGILGFDIKENFNYPYLSKSITEFWRRWHISLGSWFREYVYFPLGGNRKGCVYVNLTIVFILTGIWHGSTISFFMWGLMNAVFVILERAIKEKKWYIFLPDVVKWGITTIIVFFSWILFSATNISTAWHNYKNLIVPMSGIGVNFTWQYYLSNRIILLLVIAVIGHLCGIEKIRSHRCTWIDTILGRIIKRVAYIVLFIIDILYVVNSNYSPFMYFQF